MNLLPSHWNIKRLASLGENLDSKRIPITKSKRTTGDIPYYGASGIVDYVADYIFDEDLLLISEDGANLLARTYPIAFSVSGKSWVNNHAHVLRFGEISTQRFVEYYVNSISLEPYVSGMAQPKLNQNSLNSILIPLPPLPEQKRIVAILDDTFAGIGQAIANTEKNLKNAKELFESYLNDIFTRKGEGWVENHFGTICENLDSRRIPITKSQRQSGTIPYYGASGVVDHVADYLFDEELLLVSEDGANLLARTYPIAFSIKGRSWVNNHAHVLRFQNKCSQMFVQYYLNSISLEPYVSGMAQPKLNQKSLNSITISMPKALPDQARIIDMLDSLSQETQRLKDLYRRKLKALSELKQSILQKAFTGDLTNDIPL